MSVQRHVDVLREPELPQAVLAPLRTDAALLVAYTPASIRSRWPREGAVLAILNRNEAEAQEMPGLVSVAGSEGIALACDTSDPSSVQVAHQAICSRFGDADVLVNNAATIRPGSVLCAQVFGVAMAGVMMLSRLLAVEWGPDGVRGNAVCQGAMPQSPGLARSPQRRRRTI